MPSERNRRVRLNMLAVQIAGDFPGRWEDAMYVLQRIEKILGESVFDEPAQRPSADLVQLNVVRDDRASS